jgi:hypothetical protein
LLLVLDRFALAPNDETRALSCAARFTFDRHFASGYYLQKLDFFLRYPRYFAFELIELHAAGDGPAGDRTVAIEMIRRVLSEREPELHTEPFLRFWRGAYERLDVEAWWFSRRLVFVGREVRSRMPARWARSGPARNRTTAAVSRGRRPWRLALRTEQTFASRPLGLRPSCRRTAHGGLPVWTTRPRLLFPFRLPLPRINSRPGSRDGFMVVRHFHPTFSCPSYHPFLCAVDPLGPRHCISFLEARWARSCTSAT